jgi:dolichol-phosphate mannosyltransferase
MMSDSTPEITFVMPCYNEEQVIPYTIPRLLRAFADAGIRFELIACDNGSTDRTGEIIARFVGEGLPVVHHRVDVNEGYGNGVLKSLPLARAPWVGIIPADGQVDAEDAVRLFESVRESSGAVLGKVHRRFRLDGPVRAVVSFLYNAFLMLLWPGVSTFDVNGSPKVLDAATFERMHLTSKDWLLDPEIVIKAHLLGIPVLEMNVFSRIREHGTSNVRAETAWEFFRRLLAFRFGSELESWRVGALETPDDPSRQDG